MFLALMPQQRTRSCLTIRRTFQALPTVQAAREKYLHPAVQSFSQQKKKAKIVMYLTWG